MKNKLSIFVFALLMMVSSAFASTGTGFHLDNQLDVTGDWKWDNGWEQGEFKTAQFDMSIDSNEATQSSFVESGTFGEAWHLDYKSEAFVNAPVKFSNQLNAITVNPVDSTPATEWTKVNYKQMTGSEFSQSSLKVKGYGLVFIKSDFNLENAGGQTIDLNIN